MAKRKAGHGFAEAPEDFLVVRPDFSLSKVDPATTPGFVGGKSEGEAALARRDAHLADLQERLFAEGKGGGKRSLLLVLQGMDTSGKGGMVSHVVSAVDVQGVQHAAFRAPTEEEKRHDFLWRIEKQLPGPGMLGCFDRSHYEDVLVPRVHGEIDADELERRYSAIQDFEFRLNSTGTRIVKVMLHLSKDEQKRRLAARLDDPTKYWKYSPGDVGERHHWDAYMEAYEVAILRTSAAYAPWYVVPADNKWYARIVVQELLVAALERLDPQWPAASFDIEEEKRRLAET
ncbi:polyphosphate kinase 2 family protein [Sinomonas sp. JGH33]|uniref:Polyphosphate kinase 2 family protein n=1 Tax=Sinomonas terricola TaxID=3110330 RepID=A0ABU5T0R9_9MICC|nr:polyphosphate kinase 2 family protein [Sinomonas sp. JGH33]MEA5453247.1 polyphosphate kinase 2 family protein [Sinomonas sp. JGH33]